MIADRPTDWQFRNILRRTRCIATVGISANEVRPSFYVARYLQLKGYRILPVNPRYAGTTLLGEPAHASLGDLAAAGEAPDMIDIFRRSEEAGAIVDEALELFAGRGLSTIWMQIGVSDEAAAARARSRGIDVVMNACPKMEYQRLMGELRIGGFNTGQISSRMR